MLVKVGRLRQTDGIHRFSFRRRAMSPKSEELRRKAAEHLKLARLSKSLEERRGHRTIARSYAVLADNELWLAGETERKKRLGRNTRARPKSDATF
jgi:hypothetical protein